MHTQEAVNKPAGLASRTFSVPKDGEYGLSPSGAPPAHMWRRERSVSSMLAQSCRNKKGKAPSPHVLCGHRQTGRHQALAVHTGCSGTAHTP